MTSRSKLKVFGSIILILAVVISVWYLWPGESPPVEQTERQPQVALQPQSVGQTYMLLQIWGRL